METQHDNLGTFSVMNIDDLDAVEIFRKELEEYLEEYQRFLVRDFKKDTVKRHSLVIRYCIDYVCGYYIVRGFEDITFGMISSKMYYSFQSNLGENISRKAVFNIIKRYFEFIYTNYGIRNPKLMAKIEKAKI